VRAPAIEIEFVKDPDRIDRFKIAGVTYVMASAAAATATAAVAEVQVDQVTIISFSQIASSLVQLINAFGGWELIWSL
jgi:hypothetical protein